jgi:hypothetical protein
MRQIRRESSGTGAGTRQTRERGEFDRREPFAADNRGVVGLDRKARAVEVDGMLKTVQFALVRR